MAMNADNITVARPKVDGVAYSGGSTATLPTTASAALTGFTSLGYISADGIKMSVSKSTTDIKDMGGDTVLTIQTEHAVNFKFKPLEFNDTVKKEMFGDGNVDSSGNVKINGSEMPVRKYVFDMRGRDGKLIRVCVPNGKVTEIAEIPFKADEAVAAELTVVCFPDAQGNKAYIYCATETD